jgi:hypothetical protein
MGLALLLQQTAAPAQVNGAELRNQIQQTVREATEAAQQAAANARAARALQGGGHNIVIPDVPPIPPINVTTTGVPYERDMPPRVKDVSIAFFVLLAFVIVGLPFVRAIARRIDKGTQAPPALPKEVRDQLQQISQSVDAIAIEVERISEGQRFTTKMLADKRPQDVTMFTPGSTGQ